MYDDLARKGHGRRELHGRAGAPRRLHRGDIDTLSQRIAQIRTWTFVSNRPGWLADPTHWQEKTREIEDRLSDALHERLTKRFVDRRTSVLVRRLRENTMLEAEISPTGTVVVEGHHVGELQGFRFTADQSANGEDAKAIRLPRRRRLPPSSKRAPTVFQHRQRRHRARLRRRAALIGAPIGTLTAGDDPLNPRTILLADEQLTGPPATRSQRARSVSSISRSSPLKPLVDLKNADQITGIGRGIAFRLVESSA